MKWLLPARHYVVREIVHTGILTSNSTIALPTEKYKIVYRKESYKQVLWEELAMKQRDVRLQRCCL